jgi:hypothetical protein
MKQIIPFTSFYEAIQAFDNGGRFYNFLSHAKDGIVSPAELGKVAGATLDHQAMILYLELSISHLNDHDRERIVAHLDANLFNMYEKLRPVQMSVAQIAQQGIPGISTTVAGIPKKISSTGEFGGSVLVPVIVDAVTSFAIVPIVNAYDVYELASEEGDAVLTVAHHKEQEPLPERKLRLGGMLTSLDQAEDQQKSAGIFLEVQYYLEED